MRPVITLLILGVLLPFPLSGCANPAQIAEDNEEQSDEEVPEDPEDVAARKRVRAIANRNKGAKLVDRQSRFVEYSAAMEENPNRFEAVNGIAAQDPVSASTQAFFSAASRIHMMGLEHDLQIYRQLHGDGEQFPPFDEYSGFLKKNGVTLKGLKPFQMYAYKQETGKIVILEDPDEARQWEQRAVGN